MLEMLFKKMLEYKMSRMIFIEDINCWVYTGPDVGMKKPERFCLSLIHVIRNSFIEDTIEDIKNRVNWTVDGRYIPTRYYGKYSIQEDGASLCLEEKYQCCCSQTIRECRYWIYKNELTFRIGNSCVSKNISEELASLGEHMCQQMLAERSCFLKNKKARETDERIDKYFHQMEIERAEEYKLRYTEECAENLRRLTEERVKNNLRLEELKRVELIEKAVAMKNHIKQLEEFHKDNKDTKNLNKVFCKCSVCSDRINMRHQTFTKNTKKCNGCVMRITVYPHKESCDGCFRRLNPKFFPTHLKNPYLNK